MVKRTARKRATFQRDIPLGRGEELEVIEEGKKEKSTSERSSES
jgi:hypothetical protein